MWLHFNAFKDNHALAHEFAHSLQFSTMGLRDSPYVGWSWESNAEWMTHQMYPDQVGCSEQLLNAPHLYYGSTRDRYGNWQFWEYIKDTFGYAAINNIWSKAVKPGTPETALEDPLVVLARNQGWKTSDLNDQFGLWAMHNVTWDYKNGGVLRKCYGSYDDCSGIRRNRVSILAPVDSKKGRYAIPDYRAPQRFGYNLVRIDPEDTGNPRSVDVRFRGIVQKEPGVAKFDPKFENEPNSVPRPNSDWRWGLVAVDDKGIPRYSALQRGDAAQVSFALRENEKQLWLVVVATPAEYQRISWDQMYYTIYRYPWMVEIRGGHPRGSDPDPLAKSPGRKGATHPNGGGWVDATAHADASAFVGPAAMVLDRAQVLDKARIHDQAVISGNAKVSGDAIVRGHALVTGNGIIGGKALIEEEAAVYGGSVNEEVRLGALTLVEDDQTRIHGKADIAAVMNSIRGADISGSARLIGDIELNAKSITKGVFYGMVDPSMTSNPRWGAERTEPAPEVSAAPPRSRPK
jgi:carbonic anhydrase/acetyltransferase-like protein (isoleucine patch superfamily)